MHKGCEHSIAIISTKSGMDMLSSNSGQVYSVYFYTDTLGKGMNPIFSHPSYGLNTSLCWYLSTS